jgi:PPOX class probable F420-dependent enzyme
VTLVTETPLDRDTMTAFIRKHGDGVLSTLGPDGSPQSAYLTLAVTNRGEIVLDARETSRKVANLRRDARVAVVVGGRDGMTLQAEGLADIPSGDEQQRCADAYRNAFPQFASSLEDPAIVVVRVRIAWARLGDFRSSSVLLRETTRAW